MSGYRDGVVRTGELIAYLLRNVWMRPVGATGGNQMPSFCGRLSEILHVPGADAPAPPNTQPKPVLASPAPQPEKKTSQRNKVEPERKAEPASQATPSFDCSEAQTPAEKAICADAGLAALDNEMASLAETQRRGLQGSDLKAFTDGHLRWFRRRQVCQRNVPCLTLIYRKWIEALR